MFQYVFKDLGHSERILPIYTAKFKHPFLFSIEGFWWNNSWYVKFIYAFIYEASLNNYTIFLEYCLVGCQRFFTNGNFILILPSILRFILILAWNYFFFCPDTFINLIQHPFSIIHYPLAWCRNWIWDMGYNLFGILSLYPANCHFILYLSGNV